LAAACGVADCNCGGVDPDCQKPFENIYCAGVYDDAGAPVPIPRSAGVVCDANQQEIGCKADRPAFSNRTLVCPQLPELAPLALSRGRSWNRPPLGWVCPPELYFELDGVRPEAARCDCGCGVVDPDCGYELASCEEQAWNPRYERLFCGGHETPRDQFFCRLDSATCQPLPPGLRPNRADNSWTCIPDVYNELSDPGTTLNDCDCNCGDMDPDCFGNFNNIYCEDIVGADGAPLPVLWGRGFQCQQAPAGTTCQSTAEGDAALSAREPLVCPQLPVVHPVELAAGRGHAEPPPGWTCAPELYYESAANATARRKLGAEFACDCGCGAIDPDCGFELLSCDDQTWNPRYARLTCGGLTVSPDQLYCRLESATCQTLPPGLARGGVSEWTCIPDVYNELVDPGTSLNDCGPCARRRVLCCVLCCVC
jgi:hypothetical protein